MAARKFLFMASDGYSAEGATTDHTVLSGLVIGGGSYSAGKITGVTAGSAAGDAIIWGQNVTLGDITLGSGDDINLSGGGELTGLPTVPDGDTSATSKAYVDSVATGLGWIGPTQVLKVVDDSLVTAPTLAAGDRGDAYIVGGTGGAWSGNAVGDLVEWDGTAWVTILAGSAGEPIDGVRVTVTDTSAAGSFAGEEENIGVYDAGTDTWTFTDAAEGNAQLIIGEGGVYENTGWTYDGSAWVQFSGAGQITAGDGLVKDGNTLDVNVGDGIQIASDRVAVELDASNSGLALTGTTPDKTLGVFANTAAGLDIDGSGVKVVLETDGAIAFDGTNGGLEVVVEATNPTLDINGSNELGVKFSTTAGGLDQDATGLKAKVDGSTITINGSGQLVAAGADESTRLEGNYVAVETVAAADPVYHSSTADKFGKADAGTDAKAYVFGVAKAAIVADATGEIVSYGPCEDVLSSATPGAKYYLQDGGGIGTSIAGAGKRIIMIGWAMNADDLWVQPIDYGKKAA